jgi:hypothetical protein
LAPVGNLRGGRLVCVVKKSLLGGPSARSIVEADYRIIKCGGLGVSEPKAKFRGSFPLIFFSAFP